MAGGCRGGVGFERAGSSPPGSSWFVTRWMVVVIRRIETFHLGPDRAGSAAIWPLSGQLCGNDAAQVST
ncbi:Hypothetical protein RM25_2063 [Propionibacterium freudenreichii subsp. freudenreichii]|nr:Hypothetical protein RM25_2063 [Propionibacterium freudenreichii subsp. freudenreichii]